MSHHGHRGYPKTKQIRAERRKAAEERNTLYAKLPIAEKKLRNPKKYDSDS